MTRLAAILRRDGAPDGRERLVSLLRAGEVPGASITSTLDSDWGLAALRLPQDEEPGPLIDSPTGAAVVFDGRVDNRLKIAQRLGVGGRGDPPGDAELALRLYLEEGGDGLRRIRGPFALAIHDPRDRRLVLARDPLGCRTLAYSVDSRRALVATRVQGLLESDDVPRTLDENTIARFLGMVGPRPGATFYSAISEVPPGHLVEIDPQRIVVRRFDELALAKLADLSVGDLEERFRELLGAAVTARLRGAARPAVQMSGGLDSTSVAAMAVQARGGTPGLPAISYVFRELESCDESRWIAAVSGRLGLDSLRIEGDSEWPLREGWVGSPNPAQPLRDVYGILRRRVLELASANGSNTLLTGMLSDTLWGGGIGWLRSLLWSGRLGAALAGIWRGARLQSAGTPLEFPLRASLSFAIRRRRDTGRSRPERRFAPWLTSWGREVGGFDSQGWLEEPMDAATPDPLRGLLHPFVLALMSQADDEAERYGISLRHPFRDRAVAEFVAALPPEEQYRPGERKRLLRQAMAGWLPKEVVERTQLTALTPLLRRGLGQREWARTRGLLAAEGAVWPRWVDPDRLWASVPECFGISGEVSYMAVVWNCLSLEVWLEETDAVLPSAGRIATMNEFS